MDYLGHWVGVDGGRERRQREARVGKFDNGPYGIISFPADGNVASCYIALISTWLLFDLTRNKLKTYHDVIPISCLTEFPNVVQMAKVRQVYPFSFLFFSFDINCGSMQWDADNFSPLLFLSKLVCEEVNVDRFFPVLYPKVSSSQWSGSCCARSTKLNWM